MKKSKLPKFKSHKEEAKFWDTHDTTKYLDEFKTAKLDFSKSRKKLVSMRLPEPEIAGLKQIAARKGIGYLTMIRMWVTEKFVQEMKKAA